MTSRDASFRVPGDNFYRYEATVSESPIPTKALTSCVAYGLGDLTAQLFTVSWIFSYKKSVFSHMGAASPTAFTERNALSVLTTCVSSGRLGHHATVLPHALLC